MFMHKEKNAHIVGQEYGENVTTVSCENAIRYTIPSIIFLKGKRKKSERQENLTLGCDTVMTPKAA